MMVLILGILSPCYVDALFTNLTDIPHPSLLVGVNDGERGVEMARLCLSTVSRIVKT